MKRRLRKQRFNLVEVTLAIAILAVGLASVFVLFPVGLKAHREAIAENSIADAAEYLMSFVRAECQANAMASNADGRFSDANTLVGTQSTCVFCTKSDSDATSDADSPSSNWTAVKSNKNLFQYSHPGIFLIRQMSGDPEDSATRVVDFAAIARVYLDTDGTNTTGYEKILFPVARYQNRGTDGILQRGYEELQTCYETGDLTIERYLLPAILEISWPPNIPWDQREKRIFRFEIFNDQYDQNSGE